MDILQKLRQQSQFLRNLYARRRGLRTLLASPSYTFVQDFPPGHFYSPIPDLSDVRNRAGVLFDTSVDEIHGVKLNTPNHLDLTRQFRDFYSQLAFPER